MTAFQEIDAITTQPSSENAGSAPEVTDQQPAADGEKSQQNSEFAYDTQYSLAGGNCSNRKSSCLELLYDNAGLNIYLIRFYFVFSFASFKLTICYNLQHCYS